MQVDVRVRGIGRLTIGGTFDDWESEDVAWAWAATWQATSSSFIIAAGWASFLASTCAALPPLPPSGFNGGQI